MKPGFFVLSLLLAAPFTKVNAETLRASEAYLDLDVGQSGQLVLSYGDTREGELVFTNGGSCDLGAPECATEVARFPVIVRNFKVGLGVGITGDRTRIRINLHKWSGLALRDLFGSYYGVSALAVDLSMFVSFANLRATDVVATNRAGAWLVKSPEFAAAKDSGSEIELASLRKLQIIPRTERRVAETASVPTVMLEQIR